MALDGQAMVDPQTAVRIITAAVQTDWDRDFTSNDKIKSWLLEQVQRVPFDPRSVTLLDYVKTRMEAAKVQQKQQLQQQQSQPQTTLSSQPQSSQLSQQQQYQQQQLQYQQQQQQYQQQQQQYFQQHREGSQPNQLATSQSSQAVHPSSQANSKTTHPNSSSSYTTTAQTATNGIEYTVLSDDDSSEQQSEDDQQYQFDLSDFAEQPKPEASTSNSSTSASPLPPPLSLSQSQPSAQSSASSSTTMFPYATGHPQQSMTSAQTPSTAAAQHSFYQHQALPISQPMGLNPALLLNNQARQQQQIQQQQQPQVISPHQLMQQQNSFQVNGISLAGPSASTSASASASPAPAPVASSSNSKAKRKTEVEVVVHRRKEGAPSSSASTAKRKKTTKETAPDSAANLPSSATGSKQPTAGTSTTITPAQPLQSILSITPNTPKPPSPHQQAWNEIRQEMEKCLQQATRSPHKTVMKMFKLLSPFVSEPADAHSRQGSREAFITNLRVPAEGRLTILDLIKDETEDDFDVIFVVDPRATTLLHEWTKDLALIAKKKYEGPLDVGELKKTSRSLMAVFKKLPISLDVLRSLKGVGADVAILSKSDEFDEVTKDTAKILVKKWKALIDRAQGGAPQRSSTPSSVPAATASNKKRPEAAASTSADEESRKKRRTSPAPAVDKTSVAASDRSGNASATAAAKGPGTQPLGRLPTTIKPTTTGKVLPSFAKRKPTTNATSKPSTAPMAKAAPAPAAPAANAAFDPFALSLQHMAASKESAAGAGMSVGDTLNMLNKAMDATSAGKSASSSIPRAGQSKKKSVRWAEEDKLKMIKIVEKLVYGDEFGNEITTSEYFNTTGETVGEHEGVAMKGLVEQMDWEEPQVVDRKFSQEVQDLVVEYPSPELMEGGQCERDIQAEREKTVLAATFLSEDDIRDSPAEPTAETSAPSIPAIAEPVIMRLSHDLANDQAVQLSILQAQTARSLSSTAQDGSQPIGGTQAGQSGPSYSTGPQTGMYSQTQQAAPPPAVAGADLNSLLAQLSGSGLAASLNTVPPAMPMHMQHQPPPQHQYPHLQQYPQPYQPRY